jgi:hypothetical protein
MKFYMLFFTLVILGLCVQAQTTWKLINDKNDIKVYIGNVVNSKFKSIRVQTIFDGSIAKLMNILGNISKHPEWVYKAKSASILKQVGTHEYIYYTESILPWPLSNRDAIIHLTMMPDVSHRTLRVTAISEPDFIGAKDGLVRIPYLKATWYVTESINKINIDYTFEVDPGGELPAWLVNMLADKGPLESFQSLRMKLKL